MPFIQTFNLPSNLSLSEQVTFCMQIFEKYRYEAKVLRRQTATFKTVINRLEKEVNKWKEKYQKSQDEFGKTQKENTELKQEIERLTKTNSRYQAALFDHGNFKKQNEDIEKKSKGGQAGHPDTNRENQVNAKDEDYENYPKKRIYAKVCGSCGTPLNRVGAVKQKILLDIVLNPQMVKLLVESERQWCSHCQKEVNAKDPQTLPFTEYGLNTFMLAMILRFKGHLSMGSIAETLKIAFGLWLSRSDIANLLKTAACYLDSKYQELTQAVRKGEVIYADETGWQVRGQSAWMWIMANKKETIYFGAESRGKGIAKDLYGNSHAYAMTDGLFSYAKVIPPDRHLFCWAHLLRFAHEEAINNNSQKNSQAVFLRDKLVEIYHLKFSHPEYSKEKLESVLREEIDNLLNLFSNEESFLKIQNRLREQKEGLVLALLITEDGTNNLAERELRPMVLGRKISFGSDTYTGMQTSATLGSIIQTLGRQKTDMLTELNLSLQIGIHEKYSQYRHLAYFDSS